MEVIHCINQIIQNGLTYRSNIHQAGCPFLSALPLHSQSMLMDLYHHHLSSLPLKFQSFFSNFHPCQGAIVVRKKEGLREEVGELGGILKLAKQPMCVESKVTQYKRCKFKGTAHKTSPHPLPSNFLHLASPAPLCERIYEFGAEVAAIVESSTTLVTFPCDECLAGVPHPRGRRQLRSCRYAAGRGTCRQCAISSCTRS